MCETGVGDRCLEASYYRCGQQVCESLLTTWLSLSLSYISRPIVLYPTPSSCLFPTIPHTPLPVPTLLHPALQSSPFNTPTLQPSPVTNFFASSILTLSSYHTSLSILSHFSNFCILSFHQNSYPTAPSLLFLHPGFHSACISACLLVSPARLPLLPFTFPPCLSSPLTCPPLCPLYPSHCLFEKSICPVTSVLSCMFLPQCLSLCIGCLSTSFAPPVLLPVCLILLSSCLTL